tara:strand:- start:248 stop:418 length:171 start_codon:yes stop_codon:yes gene_type:complete
MNSVESKLAKLENRAHSLMQQIKSIDMRLSDILDQISDLRSDLVSVEREVADEGKS